MDDIGETTDKIHFKISKVDKMGFNINIEIEHTRDDFNIMKVLNSVNEALSIKIE